MKKKELGLMALMFIIGIICVSWAIFYYFTRYADETLIPFGEIMFIFPFIVMLFWVLIFYIKSLILILNNRRKKKKRDDIISYSFGIVAVIPLLFPLIWLCVLGVIDIINGPKEITLYRVQMTEKETYGKYSHTKHYLEGVTPDYKQEKIEFRFYRQASDDIDKLLEKNHKLKIYYFENLNIAYLVE